MKRILAIFISIIMIIIAFSSAMPSFALSYNGFTYEIIDEEITITGYTGSATTLTIPTQINGAFVKKIDDGAFKGNTSLVSVIVGDGIKDIGDSAFENCTSLSTISLPTSIIHIGEKAIYNTAYYNNKSNWKLKISSSDSSSGSVGVGGGSSDSWVSWEDIGAPVLQYLYLGKNLIEIELEGNYSVKMGTSVIADGAFKGNDKAVSVSLPSSIVTIGRGCFEGCSTLKTVKNLNLVTNIGDNAFKDCISFEEINIAENVQFNANAIHNTGYYNNPKNWIHGLLYMGNRVVGADAEMNEFVILDGTTNIIGEALCGKDVVIPQSVTWIADNAFASTENARIFGYTDTFAQEFANDKNITFIALDKLEKGDVNFDGKIDSEDYSILVAVSSLQKEASYLINLMGDMDDDGAIDGIDVIILDLIINDMPPSKLKGDVNGDNKLDVADYNLLVKFISTSEKITDNFMFSRADVNEDGTVDGFDAINLDLALNGYLVLV